MVVYGLALIWDQAFAVYDDQNTTSLSSGTGFVRINKREGPIPISPGMFLGIDQPSGEVYIQGSSAWDLPGEKDESFVCIVGYVPTVIFDSDLSDHIGPYDGEGMNDCSVAL